MLKTLYSKAASLLIVGMMAIALVVPAAVGAQDPFGLGDADNINVGTSTNLKQDIADIVNILLGFLGILAVVIILYAGFKWMTASGNEEQVGEARKMLLQAVIGLVIIMAAWVITNFVVQNIGGAVGQPATVETQ
ncbi:MAG: hypothetical protein HYS45_00845 [Parcubacteria group bacterium]|nr:hypothetical protein [Parcubacteria group bacterium]